MNPVRRRRKIFPNHQTLISKTQNPIRIVKVKEMMENLSQRRKKLDYFTMKHSKDSSEDFPGVMMVSLGFCLKFQVKF